MFEDSTCPSAAKYLECLFHITRCEKDLGCIVNLKNGYIHKYDFSDLTGKERFYICEIIENKKVKENLEKLYILMFKRQQKLVPLELYEIIVDFIF